MAKPLTRTPFALRGAIRSLTRSSRTLNASQPATPSSSTSNPHAARLASAPSNTSSGDARSRLAKLQAQRLEELNRGRTSPSGGAGRPNKPEQKWSNRTLIALATSVGACTYLMGTYHGYNAGKEHAKEEALLNSSIGGADGVLGAIPPTPHSSRLDPPTPPSSLSAALAQLVPLPSLHTAIQCQPQSHRPNCHLAELTQYHCDLHTNRVVCQPVDRIFRLCNGRPAVEVSHIVEFDPSGKPYLPDHLAEAMPPSSHWHELRSPDL